MNIVDDKLKDFTINFKGSLFLSKLMLPLFLSHNISFPFAIYAYSNGTASAC